MGRRHYSSVRIRSFRHSAKKSWLWLLGIPCRHHIPGPKTSAMDLSRRPPGSGTIRNEAAPPKVPDFGGVSSCPGSRSCSHRAAKNSPAPACCPDAAFGQASVRHATRASGILTCQQGPRTVGSGGLSPVVQLREGHSRRRLWPAEQIALAEIDPERAKLIQLRYGLHSFGDDGQPE